MQSELAQEALLPPRRGREKIAQGKGAQRLPPWVTSPQLQPHSSFSAVPPRRGGTAEKDEWGIFMIASLPRAALRLPWATIFRPSGACRLARYVRKRPNVSRPEIPRPNSKAQPGSLQRSGSAHQRSLSKDSQVPRSRQKRSDDPVLTVPRAGRWEC